VRLRVGTSGYSYKEWKGSFYPADLPEKQMLRFYGERFPAVEINNTFYRMPNRELLLRWAEETPPDFSFVLKAPQRITHHRRLADTESVRYFLDTASALRPKLGPVLFQLPPYLAKEVTRLRALLQELPAGTRAAFEFRHASWFDEEVYGALREHSAALCLADTDDEEAPAPLLPTAAWGYLRLRRAEYDEAGLRQWAERVKAQPWEDAYVFFKHEDEGKGPALAGRFREIWEAGA
jgi:uncharacterized protein YecE (DUF72 family)